MHGGAITLGQKYNALDIKPDIIIASDMLNLPLFKSIAETNSVPIIIYFHENQITYPWPDHEPDRQLGRDLHYHYINQTSAITADWCFFNSNRLKLE